MSNAMSGSSTDQMTREHRMTVDEAHLILNVKRDSAMEDVLKVRSFLPCTRCHVYLTFPLFPSYFHSTFALRIGTHRIMSTSSKPTRSRFRLQLLHPVQQHPRHLGAVGHRRPCTRTTCSPKSCARWSDCARKRRQPQLQALPRPPRPRRARRPVRAHHHRPRRRTRRPLERCFEARVCLQGRDRGCEMLLLYFYPPNLPMHITHPNSLHFPKRPPVLDCQVNIYNRSQLASIPRRSDISKTS